MFDISKRMGDDIVQEFDAGEIIVHEGDESRELYILQSGSAEVVKKSGSRDIRLATLKKGQFFGEMSLLEGTARSATVRALKKTRVLVIKPGGLLLKMRRDPTFAFEMLQQLSARILRMDQALSVALDSGNLTSETFRDITRKAEAETAQGGKGR